MLKWLFRIRQVQKLVLTELEKKTGRTFGGEVWNFVEQAPSLVIKDLDKPPKRPRADGAIKELQAFRAGGTSKLGASIPQNIPPDEQTQ